MPNLDDTNIARSFRAISHPRRARLFRLLATAPETGRSFRSLRNETGLCYSSLSHHLREMERFGLIYRQRNGPRVSYHLETAPLARALAKAGELAGQATAPAAARHRPGRSRLWDHCGTAAPLVQAAQSVGH